ncbi:MAG TPA: hypothetical protein VN672_09130 [Solirubrobacteraceae bacterium]|nr:hypothetical protein [Solirubrobacteraceae bacterium]
MKLLRRRRHAEGRAPSESGDARPTPAWSPQTADEVSLLVGSYLTDGRSLYRVVHAITAGVDGDRLLELEDCRTLELALCPYHVLNQLSLRVVGRTPPALGDARELAVACESIPD